MPSACGRSSSRPARSNSISSSPPEQPRWMRRPPPTTGFCPPSSSLGEPAHRGDPRFEEVLAAAGGDELRDAGQEPRRVALDGHLPAPVVAASHGVAVLAEVEDVAVVEPLTLDELELTPEAPHAGHEEQPPRVGVVVVSLALLQFGSVRDATPEHPVAADELRA